MWHLLKRSSTFSKDLIRFSLKILTLDRSIDAPESLTCLTASLAFLHELRVVVLRGFAPYAAAAVCHEILDHCTRVHTIVFENNSFLLPSHFAMDSLENVKRPISLIFRGCELSS
jgi:hypothetical protein